MKQENAFAIELYSMTLKEDDVKELLDELCEDIQCASTYDTEEISLGAVKDVMSEIISKWYDDRTGKTEQIGIELSTY